MVDPKSEILEALYHQAPDEAVRLADASHSLTVWEAAALGRDATVDRLLAADGALANTASPDGYFPLSLAAFFGRPSTVRLLLARGADVHAPAQNAMKVQPLHAAVASRKAETVALLLEHGADANARQQVGYTPLMGAAAAGREDLVDLLLGRGADPSLISEDGKTAADVAREHGHTALAERLGPPS
jgi:ankyrin repeat protein